MSDSSDDDDLPDLESVDSSEYCSEDDDSDMSDLEEPGGRSNKKSGVDKSSSCYAVARKWLELDRSDIEKQLHVISVHLFSPFLFGHAHQSDCWLRWCHEVGLLRSECDFQTDCLTAIELTAVDVLDKAMEHCRNCMMDRESPDSLFMLLQLANDIKRYDDVDEAVTHARHRVWFKCMLEVYATGNGTGPISNAKLGKNNFLEVGCLYAINQTAEHVQKFIDGHDLSIEFDESITSQVTNGMSMKKNGDELFQAGKSEEAIDLYATAIICCPYFYELYLKRAYVFLELQKFQDALSDSVRAIHLNPSQQEGYIRYIQCLTVCDDAKRLSIAQRKYHSMFPGARHKEQLRVGLDSSPAYQRRKIEASEEDRAQYEKLTGLCKQASEAYLQGNVDNALLYYDESVRISSQDKGWQHCMVLSENQSFVVSLHFAYGLALLKKSSKESLEAAVTQFTTIVEKKDVMVPFPPALYGLGKALAKLHRHGDALEKAKEGLKLLPNYHLPVTLTWPGTNEVLTEALAQNVEMLLQQLQQQCEPVKLPDAICRYGNCLQYYPSTDIQLKAGDYKGHVTLQCSDSCSISYHASCWRRYKSEGVIGADKDYLQTDCPTPDCPGIIKTVSVYDNRGKVKIKYESEATSKKAPPTVPLATSTATSASLKESRRASRSRLLRKKKLNSDSTAGDVAKETEPKPEKSEKPDKPEREESIEDQGTSQEEVSEDSRKMEDSLAVINRQAEVGEDKEKESVAVKNKTKKKKVKTVTSSVTTGFTFPDRHFESSVTAAEDTKKPSWQTDPEHPFGPPEHLRDAVDHFEKTEAPRLGLKPRPVVPPTQDETVSTSHAPSAPDEVDFVFSYFAEILKNCGPLKGNDSRLTDALLLLPDEKRQVIAQAGSLEKYLLTSFMFVSHGDLICLAEDAPVVKDSISQSSGSTSSSSSLGSEPFPSSEKTKVQVASAVASSQAVKNSRNKQTPASSSDKPSGSGSDKPSLSSLIHDGLSGGGGNSLRFDADAAKVSTHKTYGVHLGSSVNSPSNSPLNSPRLLSPTDHVNLNTQGASGASFNSSSGGAGGKQKQKLGVLPPGVAKRPNSAGEVREHTGGGTNKTSSRVIGHERQQKREERSAARERNRRGGGGGGGKGREKRQLERLLSTASDSSLGVLGDFFVGATGQKEHSSGSGSGSGNSQSEETPSAASALANSKLLRAAMSGTSSGAESIATSSSAPVASVITKDAEVQTLPPSSGVKFVQTDPLPSVENFKDRYEKVLKEKRDLQVKLERSEDQKFKMQKDHKRELEKLEKKYYTEAKREAESKIQELEDRVIEERQKGQASKRDQAELIRSHKTEIKSLMEKVEKMKKEVARKDVQIDTNMVQYHTEIEHLRSEKRRYDDRIRSEMDAAQKALRRAVDAELEVLSMRRDAVARPCEQRLKEVESMCSNVPPGSDLQRDWLSFKDKLKTSLDCFQNAMDDQVRQVKAGRELCNLDRVPNPNIPIPVNLRVPMPMMRPRFMPMMPVRGAPMPGVPGGLMMDPGMFAGPRMPVHSMAPMSMPMGKPHPSMMEGGNPMAGVEASSEDLAADKEMRDETSVASGDVDQEQARKMGGATAVGGGAGGKKKSSFERIVEKLAPLYPHYAREDFKGFLHEVRRNNKNTLSGLSLDSITDQVKAIIDTNEKERGTTAHGGKGAPGTGTGNSGPGAGKGRQNKTKSNTSRQQQPTSSRGPGRPRQQVAVADPPVMSSTDYDEDGSCIICYEDMIDFDSSRLNCGHRFHTECIRSWFKEQSTCPTCRNHSLLPEEYPFLK